MNRTHRSALALALSACALSFPAASFAQSGETAAPPVVAVPLPHVQLTTSMGDIVLELDTVRAPVTAGNFLKYVGQKRMDGTSFYRAMLWSDWQGPGQGIIQGGPRGNPKKVLPPIAHEPTDKTGIKHDTGTISMARLAPGSATGDFFILLSPIPSFDADPAASGDNAGYAAFGRVVAGMDVVRNISAAPLSSTAGQGVMRGQMIERPVIILSARKVPPPTVAPPAPEPAPPVPLDDTPADAR